MSLNWKGTAIIIIALGAVIGLCVIDLSCGAKRTEDDPVTARVKSELAAGKQEYRQLRADELAKLARDMRALAKRYLEQGDKKKAQRAIGAAQELDRKIRELQGEK